jgi:predicted small secreted protein
MACSSAATMNSIVIFKTNCKTSGKSTFRRTVLFTGASVMLIAGATSSCNTARGFGQDVEKTGDKIQEAATR